MNLSSDYWQLFFQQLQPSPSFSVFASVVFQTSNSEGTRISMAHVQVWLLPTKMSYSGSVDAFGKTPPSACAVGFQLSNPMVTPNVLQIRHPNLKTISLIFRMHQII